ncbi:MAG: hypothetical protein M3P18_22690 [Actinomycetota bacterium]|nr:hypothetical protein [Actinomycetota bacterium]
MTRVNLSVSDADSIREQAGSLRLRTNSQSTASSVSSPGIAHTGFLNERLSRVNSFVLPITIAASLFAPGIETMRRRVRLGTSTAIAAPYLADVTDEVVWNLVLERVTEAEVEALRRIWALPYPGPIDSDFRLFTD